jgi:hypothetical protein
LQATPITAPYSTGLNLIPTGGGSVKANDVALVDQDAFNVLIARVAELESKVGRSRNPEPLRCSVAAPPG